MSSMCRTIRRAMERRGVALYANNKCPKCGSKLKRKGISGKRRCASCGWHGKLTPTKGKAMKN
ncbi:MAG: hypothetical protein RR301_08820 [Clostridia bacterium]